MVDEMSALQSCCSWDLVRPCSTMKDFVGCRLVFVVKYFAKGQVDKYKALSVAKGYTRHMMFTSLSLSLMAHIISIHVIFSIAVNKDWPMFQLYVKNALLYGDLQEIVFMEQSLCVVWGEGTYVD